MMERSTGIIGGSEFQRSVADALPLGSRTVLCAPPQSTVPPTDDLLDVLSGCSTVVVDIAWNAADEALLKSLLEASAQQLRESADACWPAGLLLVAGLRERFDTDDQNVSIFICVDAPPSSLTFELLRRGADWVWPSRREFAGLAAVADDVLLLSEATAARTTSHSVLVVENSRSVCRSLRAHLGRDYDLTFVGEDKPGNAFNIDASEAIAAAVEFVTGPQPLAVIVDLALTEATEAKASTLFVEHDYGHAALLQILKDFRGNAAHVFGGLQVVLMLQRIAPRLPVIVFSNYIYSNTVRNLVGRVVAPATAPIIPVEKSEYGYRRIAKELEAIAKQQTT